MLEIAKAHAYGNDFLFVRRDEAALVDLDVAELARAMCDRHAGVGADGLILYSVTTSGASMRLINADGSPSEVSGNGVRCLGALIAGGWTELVGAPGTSTGSGSGRLPPGSALRIDTDAGPKTLTLLGASHGRYTFCAAMGQPRDIRRLELDTAAGRLEVVALTMGNPQCVVLGAELTERALHRLGPALTGHPAFPEGTNVELARVEPPDRVRILIWERGVGPTLSSGTGSCAAAVAAMTEGGVDRDVQVDAPGGSQRVEWRPDGVYLTGWAEVTSVGWWVRPRS